MIKYIPDKKNKKEYPYIEKFILDFLARHKKELPRILKVKIYDYENYLNITGLSYYQNRKTGKPYDYILEINLKQILDLYTGREKFSIPGRQKNLEAIKGIREFILFVLYHEIGHYVLGHQKNGYSGGDNGSIQEFNCDKFAYENLRQGQLEFNFFRGV